MERELKIHPDYLPAVMEFQRVFSRYFPNFEDDIYDAAGEMGWLHNGMFTNPIETVRRSKAKKDLRRLAAFVRDVSTWNWPLMYRLIGVKMEAKESDDGDRVSAFVESLYDFVLACDEMEHYELVDTVLEKFVNAAEEDFDTFPETRNINWDAVNAIRRLRTLWWRNTGMYAPSRALNPASLFACYLQDGFDFLKIDADPASAFRRWVAVRREEDIQYENED